MNGSLDMRLGKWSGGYFKDGRGLRLGGAERGAVCSALATIGGGVGRLRGEIVWQASTPLLK
jgi:hypothetical protein